MDARCTNCDHEWTLRKPPGRHKNGLKCPQCGSTRIDTPEAPDPADQPGPTDQNAQQPQQVQGQAQAPAPATQEQENAPAQQMTPQIQQGMQAGDAVAGLLDGDKADLYQGAAGMLFRLSQRERQRTQQQRQVAEQTGGLRKASQYPECPECGTQITEIPQGVAEFECPGCGTLLEPTGPVEE